MDEEDNSDSSYNTWDPDNLELSEHEKERYFRVVNKQILMKLKMAAIKRGEDPNQLNIGHVLEYRRQQEIDRGDEVEPGFYMPIMDNQNVWFPKLETDTSTTSSSETPSSIEVELHTSPNKLATSETPSDHSFTGSPTSSILPDEKVEDEEDSSSDSDEIEAETDSDSSAEIQLEVPAIKSNPTRGLPANRCYGLGHGQPILPQMQPFPNRNGAVPTCSVTRPVRVSSYQPRASHAKF